MKLNLGCFDKKLPGFTNVDIRPDCNPDIVDNAFTLETIEDNSVGLIYCCHMLEHLSYEESKQALRVWYKKLKPGGWLRLAVPDLEKACSLYLLTKDKQKLKSMFWGSQRHMWDFHKNGWSRKDLEQDLYEAGFMDVDFWSWQHVEPHSYCDDYAQSYFPDMQKDYKMSNGKWIEGGGVLLSLNLQGQKPNPYIPEDSGEGVPF
jgi:predicted SAM-dependent methyltransferase